MLQTHIYIYIPTISLYHTVPKPNGESISKKGPYGSTYRSRGTVGDWRLMSYLLRRSDGGGITWCGLQLHPPLAGPAFLRKTLTGLGVRDELGLQAGRSQTSSLV